MYQFLKFLQECGVDFMIIIIDREKQFEWFLLALPPRMAISLQV